MSPEMCVREFKHNKMCFLRLRCLRARRIRVGLADEGTFVSSAEGPQRRLVQQQSFPLGATVVQGP